MPTLSVTAPEPLVTHLRQEHPSRDISIDYLRTAITVSVIAVHSCTAYTVLAHVLHLSTPGDSWMQLVPIVDARYSLVFDYMLQFADVFFMALLFFVSSLFAFVSLRRKGALQFVRERLLRIGLPFVLAVAFVIPIGIFAGWRSLHPGGSYVAFWLLVAKMHFMTGPPWFLWVLLIFDCFLAIAFSICGRWLIAQSGTIAKWTAAPIRMAIGIFACCLCVYIPLRHHYGYGYDAWILVLTKPFYVQPSRTGMYVIWCIAGFFVGSISLESGLLARGGLLVRKWKVWVAFAAVAINALWFIPRLLAVRTLSLRSQHLLLAFLWTLALTGCSFASLAFFRAKVTKRSFWMDSLSRCAYAMYLVHFAYVLWIQQLLLPVQLPAGIKFSIVFLLSFFLSWATGFLLVRTPGVRRIL